MTSPESHTARTDLIIAVGIFVLGVISATLSSISGIYDQNQQPLWTAIVYIAIIAAPLAVRRRYPIVVGIITAVAYFAAVSLRIPEVFVGSIAVFLGTYTIGAWEARRSLAKTTRVLIIVGMFLWLFAVMFHDAVTSGAENEAAAGGVAPYVAFLLIQIMINMLYFGGAYYFGDRAWHSHQQRLALEQRTAELERERERSAAQAVALDRVRIARELHDVVAHHVSVMGVQAGAARVVLDTDPAASKAILSSVETSARDAITELRHMLETLRSPDAADPAVEHAASTLSLDDLPHLVEQSDAAGVPTALTIVGEPTPVPPSVAVNLFRIAQESLTNARRHGGAGTTADVRLRYAAASVELEIVSTGRIVVAAPPGLGQQGMRERALASGGTIESAPRPAGGWRVRVQIPLAAPVVGSRS